MKNIYAALIDFQKSLKPLEKDAENPFFKSSYLTLAGILESVLPVLTKCGLGIIQPMRVEAGSTILRTVLVHSSGETIESEIILPTNPDPQKMGSLITYYKRYQLQAMLGISSVEEDDDANAATPRQYTSPQLQGVQQTKMETGKPVLASDAQKGLMNKLGIKFDQDITKQEAMNKIKEHNDRGAR